ncbi:unnamed protein product [Brachionus calyciflorus]|uniref:Uncharacterized protein n=1 Tax=Brachionus calyciflorus TaxID=104777 RepID=A0A813TU23_9BILA|nr:unnamed protein product [Brachionus calyciflorus]
MKLKGDTAIFTRQNPNGDRFAYECPEERDYYPYWKPTKWIDIAVLTNDPKRCTYFRTESENVKSRFYCKIANNYKGIIPIDKLSCEKINGSIWIESPSHNVEPPVCRETQFTRDNHLGNTYGGQAPNFNWKIPNITQERCVLRIRYNISTNDYDLNQPTSVDLNKKYGLSVEEANSRDYILKNNPKVKLFSDLDFGLNLAINTAQYGRVFQDRSHVFSIRSRQNIESDRKILNLNVRGKRGNIVQVYPSVEYDFTPNKLEASKNDFIHIQWTGSNKNPLNNAGQGLAGTDRSNIVLLTNKTFGISSNSFYAPLELNGDYGVNYPLSVNQANFLGMTKEDLIRLALLEENHIGGSMEELDDAGTYFDLGPRKITNSGVYHYMSSRNNNFSNRDQKGEIITYEHEFYDDYIGSNGGRLEFRIGFVNIPEGALDDLEYFRIDIKTKQNVNGSDLDTKVLKPNKFDESTMASDLIVINKLKNNIKKAMNMKLRLKRGLSGMESHNLYRINNELLTKVESKIKGDVIEFETQESGIYVVKYEKYYGVLIGVLVGLGVLIILVGAAALFLYKNPQYVKSLRYKATNVKRSMNNQL